MRWGKDGNALLAAMLAGFALLCCASVACIFPNSLMSNDAPRDAYRAFNMAFGISTSVMSLCYGLAVARFRRVASKVFFVGAMGGTACLHVGWRLRSQRAAKGRSNLRARRAC